MGQEGLLSSMMEKKADLENQPVTKQLI